MACASFLALSSCWLATTACSTPLVWVTSADNADFSSRIFSSVDLMRADSCMMRSLHILRDVSRVWRAPRSSRRVASLRWTLTRSSFCSRSTSSRRVRFDFSVTPRRDSRNCTRSWVSCSSPPARSPPIGPAGFCANPPGPLNGTTCFSRVGAGVGDVMEGSWEYLGGN